MARTDGSRHRNISGSWLGGEQTKIVHRSNVETDPERTHSRGRLKQKSGPQKANNYPGSFDGCDFGFGN